MAEKSAGCKLLASEDSSDLENDFEMISHKEAMASRLCDSERNDELVGESAVHMEDKARSYKTEEAKHEVDESLQQTMFSRPTAPKEEITFKLTEMPKGSGRWMVQIGDIKEMLPEEIKIISESETKISKDEDNNIILTSAQNKYYIRENDGKLVFHHVDQQASEQGDLPGGIKENIKQTERDIPEHDSDMYKGTPEMQMQVHVPKTQSFKGQDQSNFDETPKINTGKIYESSIEKQSDSETKKHDGRSSPELEKPLLGASTLSFTDKTDKDISEHVGQLHDEIENIQAQYIAASAKSSEDCHKQTTDVVDQQTNCPNEEKDITILEGKDTISSGTEKSSLSAVAVVDRTSSFRNQTWTNAGAEGTGISNRDQQKQHSNDKTSKLPSCTPEKNELKEYNTDIINEDEYESSFQVPFITEVILNYSEEKAKLKDRFPGLHCEFSVRNETKYCKLCGSYEDYSAAKDYILKVPSYYGSVEIEWKNIKNNEKIKSKERMFQALLKEARKDYTETDGYWLYVENTKLYIVSKMQSLADSLAQKIKKNISCKEEILIGEMRQANYVETVKMIISEQFTDEVECEVDQDTFKLRLVGLKVSIYSLLDHIKPVTKTVQILDRDMLDFIVEKAEQQSGGRVNLTPLMRNDKQGICIKGPSLYVGEICDYIDELQKIFVHSTVAITSRSQSQFLENKGGKHFLKSIKDSYEVEVVEEMLEVPDSDRFEETQWILPAGHQIVVTTKDFGEVEADMRLCPNVKGNEGSSHWYRHLENIQTMTLPSNRLDGKHKHECHETIDRMLQEAKERGLFKVSMLLIEDECWGSVKQQLKNFLYPVRRFLSSSELAPMTFTLCMQESGQYKEATKITSNFLSPERSAVGRLNVTLTKGNICDQQVDVLVNTTNSSLDMKATAVSAVVAARAGPELQKKCRHQLEQRESLKPWQFVVTDGCKLQFQYMFHGVPEKWNITDGIKQLQNFIYRCLVRCNELEMKSIAFPAIGTGKLQYPPREVAAAFFEAARYFEMKIPHAYLKDMTIVIYEADELIFKDFLQVEQVEKGYRQEFSIDGVSICVRKENILRHKADTVVYFWEMKALEAAKTSVSPFMSWLGTQVNEEFSQKCSGHTFETRGGNLNASTVLHVPYRNDAGKLASAFKEAISFISNQGAVTSAVFFNKKHPMLKHVRSIPEALMKAVKSESQTDNLKLLSIIVEDEKISQSIQRGLEGYRIKEQKPHGELHADSDVNVTTLPMETSKKGLKLVGLKENVEKARLEIESKLREVEGQHMTVSFQGQSALEPPGAMAISAEERGYPTTDGTKDISTQRKGYSEANKNISVEGREYPKTDKEKDIFAQKREHSETEIGQPEEEKGHPHRKKQKDGNTHTNIDEKEQELQGARPKELSDNKKKISQSSINKESAQQVDKNMPKIYPTLDADPDETLCIEVEISEARDNDSHGSLFKDIYNPPFPVAPPRLIYPFENRTKALLVCQSCDDADKLELFKEKSSKDRKYLFKRFQPQSLQMCQITLPTSNLESWTKTSTLEEIEERLDEMGVVETSGVKDEPSLTVQTYSLAQVSLIQDYLQQLIDTLTKTNVSDSAYQHVDTIADVNPMVWKIVNVYLTKHLTELKQQNANVYFDNCSIVIDWGCEKGINLSDFVEAVDYFKSVHTEEIKPSKYDSTEVYKAWCCDIKDVLMSDCCFYDEESRCFIAFGNSYDVIQKVKHQLGIKQGTVKQTARSRVRNFGVQQVRLNDDVNPGPLPISSGASDLRPPLPDPIVTSDFRQPLSDPVSATGVRPKNINKTFNLSDDAQEVKKYITVEGIRVYVYIANILKLPVDCIVNAANDTLKHGGGVALVIARAAGKRLTEEGDRYVRKNGLLPVGKACTTTAGDLPYKYVIHAVGPRWSDYWPHTVENVKRCERLLQNAILSSFTEAMNRGQKTIALPAISSAIFGVPEEMCAVQYARAIQKYSCGMPRDEKRLTEIHFIDKNPSIVRLIQKTFQTMIEERRETDYDLMCYVKHNPSQESWNSYSQTSERSDPSKQKQSQSLVLYETRHYFVLKSTNGIESYVYSGNILEVYKRHVSAIVCSEDDMGRGKGGLALSLIKKAEGFSYRSEKTKAFASKKPAGQIVVCNGQGTGYNHVLHAILWSSGHTGSHMVRQKDIVFRAYWNIFFEAFRLGIKSIAIPVLGTGSYKAIKLEESAEAFLTSYQEFCNKNLGELNVHLICGEHRAMMVVIDVFKKLLQKEELVAGRDTATQNSGTGRDTTTQDSGTGRDTKTQDSRTGRDTPTQDSGTGRDTPTQDSGTGRDTPTHYSGRDRPKDSVEAEKERREEDAAENCAICMDVITQKKLLPCGHIFCTDCIDNYLNNYKKACPTCGKACGIIIGDQPHGNMNVEFKYSSCAGYEGYGRIEITYSFHDGRQGPEHPDPGSPYKGIIRTAYLPDNEEGRKTLELLRIAFDRKLIFTIGHSRTTGKEGVITWNDIHHKTNPRPHANFGYPDPGYFQRVKEELAVKGVTVDDIPELGGRRATRGSKH